MLLKTWLRYPFDIRRAHRLLAQDASESKPLAGRPIVLDLATFDLLFDCARHLQSLAQWAADSGSPVTLRCRPLVLAALSRKIHGRELLRQANVTWIPPDSPISKSALVLCDSPPELSDGRVYLRVGRDVNPDAYTMPYPMHPHTHPFADDASLNRLRTSVMRCGILFAGNQKPKYGHPKMQTDFGVLSRLDVLGTIREAFPSRIVESTQAPRRLGQIVLSDSRHDSIAAADWLPTLAAARFFLCCPGAAQPMCHHLVEAMSVGTIPILEYSDRIIPNLVDGHNAICFQGREGLIDAIDRIDRMGNSRIEQMSRHAAAYYDDHLCGPTFMRRLCRMPNGSPSRTIDLPYHDRNLYDPIPLPSRRSAAA